MHIPACETQKIDVLKFDDALIPTEDADFDREKWLYIPDTYSEYRYILGTRGKNPLICVGINPSTAVPDNLDNTVKTVERTAARSGFDSWIMFNVYPQRATRPDDMDKLMNEALCDENMKAFRYILSLCDGTPVIWAAWGAIIEKRDYLPDIVLRIAEEGKKREAVWCSFGKISVKGHPHHPLYLSNSAPKEEFDIDAYCKLLKSRQTCKTKVTKTREGK